MDQTYEVAMSFAGEDRPYVDEVVHWLRVKGVTAFYDADEQDRLWGQDLYVYLDDVYRKGAQFCVMFISKAYAEKLWTNHERISAQSREFMEKHSGYILPARFDDTEIPGLPPIIGYIDLRHKSPFQLSEVIELKIRGRREQLLRLAMSKAIDVAMRYLQPQPLSTSDALADEIRAAFLATGYSPNLDNLKPYLQSSSPAERVVGYIAYQTGPFMWAGKELSACLERELSFAVNHHETRPLWQLLTAIAVFGTVTNAEEQQFLKLNLDHALETLDGDPSIDRDGECKRKLRAIMDFYPWMGNGRRASPHYRYLPESLRHFKWQNGQTTYSLEQALEFIRGYPDVAAKHIREGHFQSWYSVSVPTSATPQDLAFAISAVMVKEIASSFGPSSSPSCAREHTTDG